jgi:hypothetical protein
MELGYHPSICPGTQENNGLMGLASETPLHKNSVRNTTLHHYNDGLVMLLEKIIAVHNENHAKPINTKYIITDRKCE